MTAPILNSFDNIIRQLKAKKSGGSWVARCPAHDDRTPSLSINRTPDGVVLFHCHAGCPQEYVIDALQRKGLWSGRRDARGPTSRHLRNPVQTSSYPTSTDNRLAAVSIWRASLPAQGTPVVAYLKSRGLTLPIPDAIRFHPELKHPTGDHWPAMVALVTNGIDGTPIAVHRTYLARDGGGKAPVDPQRMMLGPCRGGAVRLAEPGGVLMVGEGIETCIAAMQATGNPVWAALSTSGLRSLDLPKDVDDVIVLADGDEAGEAAARDCALRWTQQGRRVRIARPPQGLDFNDMLLAGRATRIEGRAQ